MCSVETHDHREREPAGRRNFGVSTEIQTGPDGHLYVVSISRGEILEIFRAVATLC